MAEVVLFHHVLGLTRGVIAMADDLRAAGHLVHTPDLFAGRTFASIDDGAAHVDEVGIAAILERADTVLTTLPDEVVVAGISLGVLPAQRAAQTRTGVRGALLFEACVPTDEFGDRWPHTVPVQIHGMADDPFFAGEGDIDAAHALVAEAAPFVRAELFVYPGDGHLFTDRSVPAHDADAAHLVLRRANAFLGDVDHG